MANSTHNKIYITGKKIDISALIEELRTNSEELFAWNMEDSISNANWQSKDSEISIVEIYFDTANGFPLDFMTTTVSHFPQLHIRLTFLNYYSDISGCVDYDNGLLTKKEIGRCEIEFHDEKVERPARSFGIIVYVLLRSAIIALKNLVKGQPRCI